MPFPNLRLATLDEVATIQDRSDLGPGCTVFAWDVEDKPPVLAVARTLLEVDPVFFPEGFPNQKKVAFYWVLENALKFSPLNPPAYYFQVNTTDVDWQNVLEKLGAERTSTTPEFRFKKVIK